MYTPLLIITPLYTIYQMLIFIYYISTLDIYIHVVCRWGVYNFFCFIPVNLLIKLQTPVVSKIKNKSFFTFAQVLYLSLKSTEVYRNIKCG